MQRFLSYLDTPLGSLLVLASPRGLVAVRFLETEEDVGTLPPVPEAWLQPFAAFLGGDACALDIPIDPLGTDFQLKVWKELREIPYGETRTYADVAGAIGRSNAVRAVARACASNNLALIVPCHRVLPRSGGAGGYRWGVERKQRLLELESSLAKRGREGGI